MIHIDSTTFGSITIDGKRFGQVLIIGDKVMERDEGRLNELFGTTHYVGSWEVDQLLSGNPEVIIIGNGTAGVLEVSSEAREKIKEKKVELKVLLTPLAVKEYNKEVEAGRRINALMHTTC